MGQGSNGFSTAGCEAIQLASCVSAHAERSWATPSGSGNFTWSGLQ
jgi:hypothetical protein